MKRIVLLALLGVAFSFSIPHSALAVTGVHRGKITNVYTNQNGNIAFNVINLDGSSSTTPVQMWVPGSSSGARNMLAVLLAAWQNGNTVTFTGATWQSGLDQTLDLWLTQ